MVIDSEQLEAIKDRVKNETHYQAEKTLVYGPVFYKGNGVMDELHEVFQENALDDLKYLLNAYEYSAFETRRLAIQVEHKDEYRAAVMVFYHKPLWKRLWVAIRNNLDI